MFNPAIFCIAMAALAANAQASQCPATNTIAPPADFVWTYQSSPEPHYLGTLVAGATVTGDFSGTITENDVIGDPTDAAGATTLGTLEATKGKVSVTFCVDSITHPGLLDFTPPAGSVCASN